MQSSLCGVTVAQLQTITIKTVATLTKRVSKLAGASFDPINGWPESLLGDGASVAVISTPTHIEEIFEDEHAWTISAKAEIELTKSVTTSDEEHKGWRLIDWDDVIFEDDVTVDPHTDELFEVVGHDSEWAEDEDEEEPEEV